MEKAAFYLLIIALVLTTCFVGGSYVRDSLADSGSKLDLSP